MTFTSIAFIFFFVIITSLYYLCPAKWRWAVLLAGSCYFYAAFVPAYLLVLFGLILVDFVFVQLMEKAEGKRRTAYLLISIISNVGLLFVFKYFNFFNDTVTDFAHFIHWNYSVEALKWALPLGLSFHTFQSLSYVIEVYRKKYSAERHLGVYALYVLFYPQLVAGPIERPQHLLPQLKLDVPFDRTNIYRGVRLMLWGFFKKVVVADRLAVGVTYVYAHVGMVPGLSVALAILMFALQLYTDFSGYSDIARGSAQTLGINVMRNFNQPYFSLSVAEFWRRWHISLSTWFRDYFYFPLAYAAKKPTRAWLYMCLMVTFLVTGVWHGAGWTFVILGVCHGGYIVIGMVTKSWREKLVKTVGLNRVPRLHVVLQTLITFVLVSLSWIFFRSPNMSTAISLIKNIFYGWGSVWQNIAHDYFWQPFHTLGMSRNMLMIAIIGALVIVLCEFIERYYPEKADIEKYSVGVQACAYGLLVFSVIIFCVVEGTQFIYFQF